MDAVANFGQDSSFTGEKTSGSSNAQDDNGQGDFYYAPPSGYLALCSANLPDTTISPNQDTQADDHFNTVLWTGNATDTNITGVGFQPDWVWAKNRSNAYHHALVDSSRGATKVLKSSATSSEGTFSEQITGFLADGFSVGDNSDSGNYVNINSHTYVAWNWKANGGTTSSNTDGNETSTVQVNTDAGFSIVLWTGGSNVQTHTFGHGLGVKPAMVIHKRRGSTSDWSVWHQGVSSPNDNYLLLNSQASSNASTSWEQPTTTVLQPYIGSTGDTWVSYVFAEIEGYSKFGSYTGNGNADGTFVFTGFRPAWIMFKVTNTTGNWNIYDSVRDPDNIVAQKLRADGSNAEVTSSDDFDILSNGFKLRDSGAGLNSSSNTYIYMAFAEQPFKFSNAR